MVTDNKIGRMPADGKDKNGSRFIDVADATGTISMYLNAESSGLRAMDLPEPQCSEKARCFFNAVISGIINWSPSQNDIQVPAFFLKNGTVRVLNAESSWNAETQLMFPTTESCRLMSNNRFLTTHMFTTTAFCGKIDAIGVNQAGNVTASLTDPLGFAVFELESDVEGGIAARRSHAKEFLRTTHLDKGVYVVLKGPLAIEKYENGRNAAIRASLGCVAVEEIDKDRFKEFVERLCRMNPNDFIGK